MAAPELHRTYHFLTRLRDEFEPLRAQLLARRPYVSLMDGLAEVRNEEIHLPDASLLQSTTILVAHSSAGHSLSTRPATPVPLASPLIVPPTVHGESIGLHHCGHDGHMEAFCYRKKKTQKAQAHRSSQGTGSGGSERSSAGSEIQEILMLLCHLAASTSLGAAGSVTQPSAPTGSALGPPSAPSPGTNHWYLDYGAPFI
jgi:hypothetical protein